MPKPAPRLLVPAALAAAATAVASGTLLTGCSPSRISGCTDVSLAVRDTRIERVTDDLRLTARLTADGGPVAGRRVDFWLYDKGPGQPPGSGVFVGTKPTDADGVARLTVIGGPAGVLTAGATPTGFGAEKPRREDYCGASAKAGLICGATAPAPCPAIRLTVP